MILLMILIWREKFEKSCILFEVRYHSFDIIEPVTFYYVKFYQQNFQINY